MSADGIAILTAKLAAVQQYPVTEDVKSLRSFLGLCSYKHCFVPNFSIIASPLFTLTRKDEPFLWSDQCPSAFQELKDILTQSPVLAFPNFEEFILETDASAHGLGAVLSQKQKRGAHHPIAYASCTLQPHEKNYEITEIEGIAVVWAGKHFRRYLYGHRYQLGLH